MRNDTAIYNETLALVQCDPVGLDFTNIVCLIMPHLLANFRRVNNENKIP